MPVQRCRLSVLSFFIAMSFLRPASVICVFCSSSSESFESAEQVVDPGIGDASAPHDQLLQIRVGGEQFQVVIGGRAGSPRRWR